MFSNKFGYDSRLPEEIREIFMWLCQDLASLQDKWCFYLELYSSEENAMLLSDLARYAFQIIEEMARYDITMAICRMSDPPKSLGKDNISIPTLIQKCRDIDYDISGINALKECFLKACEPVREYRNKRVAHHDYNTTIQPHDNLLPDIGRKQIEKIIQLASEILNTIYQHSVDGEFYFQPSQTGGADTLIIWLKRGREYEEEKRRRLDALVSQQKGNK